MWEVQSVFTEHKKQAKDTFRGKVDHVTAFNL